MKLSGKVWKLGDNVSVFDLLPAKYDDLGLNDKWTECATHLLEEVDPSFGLCCITLAWPKPAFI